MLENSDVRSSLSLGGWSLLAIGTVTLALLPARAQESPRASPSKPSAAAKDASAGNPRPASDSGKTDTKPAAQAGKYYVAGSVFDEETRQPIADADLRFVVAGERDPEKRIRRVSTDSQGHFRLEVPLGSIQLWFPELKPGYWVEPKISITALATSADKPVAMLDIPAKRAPAWPVRVVVENGIPENARPLVSVREVEDDATRTKLLNGEPVSFMELTNDALSRLDSNGRGAFTQCGKSGKLWIAVNGDSAGEVKGLTTELLVDPAFDITKVKTATPMAGTDKVELIDENGAKATIGKAEVTLTNGRPLLTFHLERSKFSVQEFIGRIVDAAGQPIPDVRVGTAVGESGAGSGEWPHVAKTDREGRFRLRVRLPEFDRDLELSLILNKDGYASFDSREFPLPKKPVEAIDLGKFTMQVGYSLPIRVVDNRDRPLAGAVVEPSSDYALRRLQIRTDAEGRGVLQNLPAGRVQVRIAHADQGDHQHVIVSRVEAENTETRLRIKPAANPPAASAKPPEPIAVGKAAPELVIEEWTDGKPRRLADYRGRVVVLDFWGTWCGSCITSIPVMQELADKYEPRGVIFLAIHTADGELDSIKKLNKVYAWKTVTGIDHGTAIDDGASSKLYGVHGYPTVIVIDAEGKIAYNSGIEPKDIDEFMKDMQQLAESLQIPWPLSEKSEEESVSQMKKLNAAMFSREIDKAIAAARK
jgi:thiol-disulfide isomerase/thioredoxin